MLCRVTGKIAVCVLRVTGPVHLVVRFHICLSVQVCSDQIWLFSGAVLWSVRVKTLKNTVLSCLSCRGTSDSWTCEEQCAGISGGRQRHAASHLRVGATIIELQVEFNLHAVQNKRCGVYILLSQLSLLIFLLSVQSSSAMTTLSVATWLGLLLLLACMDPTWWSRLRCVCLCISVMFCNCSECSFNFFFMMSSGWPLAGV